MADVKISALPSGTAGVADELPTNQSGTTRKFTVQSLFDAMAPAAPTGLCNGSNTAYTFTRPINFLWQSGQLMKKDLDYTLDGPRTTATMAVAPSSSDNILCA